MQRSLLQIAPPPPQVPVPPAGFAQQGPPSSPHVAQIPPVHLVWGAVHAPTPELLVQHGRPLPPQVPHEPALQTPPPSPTQDPPTAMQIPPTQQPPLPQPLPAQHWVPGSPHAATVPPPEPPSAPPAPVKLPPAPKGTPPMPCGMPPLSSSAAPSECRPDPPQLETNSAPVAETKRIPCRQERIFEITAPPWRAGMEGKHPPAGYHT